MLVYSQQICCRNQIFLISFSFPRALEKNEPNGQNERNKVDNVLITF